MNEQPLRAPPTEEEIKRTHEQLQRAHGRALAHLAATGWGVKHNPNGGTPQRVSAKGMLVKRPKPQKTAASVRKAKRKAAAAAQRRNRK